MQLQLTLLTASPVSSSVRRIGYISAGRADGVRPGMPVTSPTGLVGRVLEAGSHSSRVLLLTDSESMVPVRRATDNTVALAEGRSDGQFPFAAKQPRQRQVGHVGTRD